jgi:hypothetical protein
MMSLTFSGGLHSIAKPAIAERITVGLAISTAREPRKCAGHPLSGRAQVDVTALDVTAAPAAGGKVIFCQPLLLPSPLAH